MRTRFSTELELVCSTRCELCHQLQVNSQFVTSVRQNCELPDTLFIVWVGNPRRNTNFAKDGRRLAENSQFVSCLSLCADTILERHKAEIRCSYLLHLYKLIMCLCVSVCVCVSLSPKNSLSVSCYMLQMLHQMHFPKYYAPMMYSFAHEDLRASLSEARACPEGLYLPTFYLYFG